MLVPTAMDDFTVTTIEPQALMIQPDLPQVPGQLIVDQVNAAQLQPTSRQTTSVPDLKPADQDLGKSSTQPPTTRQRSSSTGLVPFIDPAPVRRKRLRSPNPISRQELSKISNKSGVPEAHLGLMCIEGMPVPSNRKRKRTANQSKNRKDVTNAGGACLLCILTKKPVRQIHRLALMRLAYTNTFRSAPVDVPANIA